MEIPEGGVRELVDFMGDKPVYLETMNADAAISTAADLVRTSPYTLDGSGLTVGVWDAGGGRPTHQEFATGTGSRLTNMNGTYTHYHSMHVAGTIAAFGVDPLSRGMANNAKINSFDWNSDMSEMLAAGATASNQTATKVYLSNHSYGVARGWSATFGTGTGTNQNAYAIDFGQYGPAARELDATIYSTPYLLSFWSAGNERNNNPPTGHRSASVAPTLPTIPPFTRRETESIAMAMKRWDIAIWRKTRHRRRGQRCGDFGPEGFEQGDDLLVLLHRPDR